MVKNYFKTAFRIFTRNKVFTAINVLGLSIGISAALIIFLIVQFEYSFDKVETDARRIYRVVMDFKFNGMDGHSAAVPAPLSTAIQREVPGVGSVVPLMQFQGDGTVKVSVKRSGVPEPTLFKKQPGVVFTNSQYFSLLPFEWIAGTPASSLKDPFQVVLTESRARQYFPSTGTGEIIGRQIRYNDDFQATVAGIVKDLDAQTSFGGLEFISFATIAQTHLQGDFMMDVWNDWMAYSQVYIKLADRSEALHTEKQLNILLNKYNRNASKDDANYMRFHLQPLNDVHFNSSYAGFDQRLAHEPTLRGLLAVAAFLLVLACINFINLSTAKASHRAKEIGVRKTLGSSRRQLIFQFLNETFLLALAASVISFFLAPLLLNLFADNIPPGLKFRPFHQPYIFLFLLAVSVVVSFLSGLYPAFILSGYRPVSVLKDQPGMGINGTRHAWIRKTLTVSQFVIAQFFIIATVMVSKQVNYALNADAGFRKDAVLSFSVPSRDTLAGRRTVLLDEIKAIPGVQMASRGFMPPAAEGASFTNISYEGAQNENKEMVQLRWGDANYLKLFDIRLLAGRNVSESDTIREFLINETYARYLGFSSPEEALGKQLDFNGKKMPIVGVMRDFHAQSFHGKIGPLVFASFGKESRQFHVLLRSQQKGGAWSKTIAGIQKAYNRLYPDEDFTYKFLDDTVARFYQREQRTAGLLRWATGLSILISCLGLLGLVMYTINSRTKEIGVRKILGATVLNIVSLLSRDFMRLVFIAFIIAAPVAWWAINKWLEDFAYRTAMSWWVFALCGLFMLLIALGTLGIQTVRTAIADPVRSLRRE